MALFDAPAGGSSVNLVSGSPEYQDAIVSNTERRLKPQFKRANEQQQQLFASRGMLDSGLGAQAGLGLREAYLDQLGGTAERAAVRGADTAEENRRRTESRGWQVEDRNMIEERLRRQAEAEENRANQQVWGSLIGGAAGGFGGLLGNVAGRALFGGGQQQMQPPPMDDGMPLYPDLMDESDMYDTDQYALFTSPTRARY